MTPSPRIPEPDGLHAEFYQRAQAGTLHLRRCADCAAYQHPPRYLCHRCGSERVGWVPSPGLGTLWSWTTTHRVVDRGWTEVPYSTGVIELDEGVRLVGALDVPPERLALGLPLEVALDPMTETFVFLTLRAR